MNTTKPNENILQECLKIFESLYCGYMPKKTVLAFLVIYHEIRDFEHEPRDKNFCSVTSHEPLKVRDFGKFPKKLGKSSNFAQKVIISVTKNQK